MDSSDTKGGQRCPLDRLVPTTASRVVGVFAGTDVRAAASTRAGSARSRRLAPGGRRASGQNSKAAPHPSPRSRSAILWSATSALTRSLFSPGRSARQQERLRRPVAALEDVPVRQLERQVAEIAAWRTTLPERYRYAVTSAFRQVCAAGVRWQFMAENPVVAVGPNPQPPVVEVEPFTSAEVEEIAVDSASVPPLVVFAADSGPTPLGVGAARRQDIDRVRPSSRVERTVPRAESKPYGKTARSRRARAPLPSGHFGRTSFPHNSTRHCVPRTEGGRPGLELAQTRMAARARRGGLSSYRRPYALRHTSGSAAGSRKGLHVDLRRPTRARVRRY